MIFFLVKFNEGKIKKFSRLVVSRSISIFVLRWLRDEDNDDNDANKLMLSISIFG